MLGEEEVIVAAGWRACWRSPSGRNTSLPTVLPDVMLNYHLRILPG